MKDEASLPLQEEARKPTPEQYDEARVLTERVFSEYPQGRTMMVAKWIARRDESLLTRSREEARRTEILAIKSQLVSGWLKPEEYDNDRSNAQAATRWMFHRWLVERLNNLSTPPAARPKTEEK